MKSKTTQKIDIKNADKDTMKAFLVIIRTLAKLSKDQQRKLYSALGEVI